MIKTLIIFNFLLQKPPQQKNKMLHNQKYREIYILYTKATLLKVCTDNNNLNNHYTL